MRRTWSTPRATPGAPRASRPGASCSRAPGRGGYPHRLLGRERLVEARGAELLAVEAADPGLHGRLAAHGADDAVVDAGLARRRAGDLGDLVQVVGVELEHGAGLAGVQLLEAGPLGLGRLPRAHLGEQCGVLGIAR